MIAVAIVMTIAAGCGGDDDNGGSADTGGDSAPTEQGNGDSGGGGGGSSTLVVDGETIDTGNALCHLEPEEAVGSDGMILATAQISGTNAAGEAVMLDFTRWDEDSPFHGDDVSVYVGEIGESVDYTVTLDEGEIDVSGDTVTGSDLTMEEFESGTSVVVSFELAC